MKAAEIGHLINFRFLISNLANIQINVYMLLFAVVSVYYYSKHKEILAGLFLALGISLKVYIIFLFPYYLFKREFRGQDKITHELKRRASAKDVVESFGIPHTEVGEMRVNGQEISFSHQWLYFVFYSE